MNTITRSLSLVTGEVDGVIVSIGETFEVDPIAQGDNVTFEYGPAVPRAAVQALSASGQTEEDVASYTGRIAEVSRDEIVIDGSDGERSFDISTADDDAFDVPHLEDHEDEGTIVKVYFKEAGGSPVGLAYEDA